MIPLICQYKSNSWIQKVELWLPEVGGVSHLTDTEFQNCKIKSSIDLFYNSVNISDTTKLYSLKWLMC